MATLLLLLACAGSDCPTFADVVVTDPDGLAEDGEVARIEAAVAEFAAWTGREGVCVDEVRLVGDDALEDGVGGTFSGSEDLVRVRAGGSVESVTRHELCHALDQAAGYVSSQRPDLFPPEAVDLSEHYPNDRARSGEAFARRCAYGPRSLALVDALEANCGEDLGSARQRFLNDTVFAVWTDTSRPAEGTVPVTLERVEVGGGGPNPISGGDLVAGGPDVYAITDWGLLRVEGATGRFASTTEVPGNADLVGGAEGPLVVVPGEGAWKVVGDALEERAFPTVESVGSGAVFGEEAWVVARVEGQEAFLRVDLSTGEAETVALPEEVTELLWLNPGPASLWGVGRDADDERVLVGFDPTTRTWSSTPVPGGWYGTDVVAGADGRLVGVWTDALAMGREYDLTGIGAIDPADGRWWLAEDACGATGLSMTTTPLWTDGGPIVWEWSNGWEEGDEFWGRGHAIARVRVGG